jgi:hypothetical protein
MLSQQTLPFDYDCSPYYDIWIEIVNVALRDDFHNVFTLRATCLMLGAMVENITTIMLKESLGHAKESLLQRNLPDTKPSSVLVQFLCDENVRLDAGIRYLSVTTPFSKYLNPFTYHEEYADNRKLQRDKNTFTYTSLLEKKEKLAALVTNTPLINKFANISIAKNQRLFPDFTGNTIKAMINCRLYEGIDVLYKICQKNQNICLDNVIDAIYNQAVSSYTDVEFIRLLQCIPIDLNRTLSDETVDNNTPYNNGSEPLLHRAAVAGNVSLVTYLLNNDVDLHQVSDKGQSILQRLEEMKQQEEASMQSEDEASNKASAQILMHYQLIHDYINALLQSQEGKEMEGQRKMVAYQHRLFKPLFKDEAPTKVGASENTMSDYSLRQI